MKKVLSLIITLVMMLNFVGLVQADAIVGTAPNLDMEVGMNGNFVNGPMNLGQSTATVDFRTTLYMSSVKQDFNDLYEVGIKALMQNRGLSRNAAETAMANLDVTGEFTVTINYPRALQVPAAFTADSRSLEGFNATPIFKETKRTATDGKITIKIAVKDALKAGDLKANLDTYFDDMTLTANGVFVPAPGTYTATGTMTGKVFIKENGATKYEIVYTGKQSDAGKNPSYPNDISATVILTDSGAQPTPPTSDGDVTLGTVLKFNIDGNTTLVPSINGPKTVSVADLPKPTKAGYTFDGWYYDSALTRKVDGDFAIDKNMTLYGHFKSTTLDTEDHFAYIVGYPDGTVKPQNNITREEVATIFYRLLREDKRAEVTTTHNDFTDVDASRWSNKAISTLANGGYINGYSDGTFGPAKPITRAEFATMATRYAVLSGDASLNFTDVNGHWAKDYINKAAAAGWVNGYSDGSFGPQKYITRAEVMAIINRMLVRYVDEDGVHADAKHWSDMNGSEWYYWIVIEATNAHDYERREDGQLENWTRINENKIIKEFDEKEAAE